MPVLLFLLLSCGNDPLDVDVSEVKVTIEYIDLDAIVYNSDSVNLLNNNRKLKKELGELYDYYTGYCLQIGDVSDTAFVNSIQLYRKDTFIVRLENTLAKEFDDKKHIQANIDDGFKHLKYHVPGVKIPEHIVWMNTLFNSNVWCTEKSIGVGLERYLGYESDIVKRLPPSYYDWVKRGMDRTFLEIDVMTGWIETNVILETEGTLVEQMIRWGKIAYLVQAAYPDVPEHLILRYTEDQFKWALENEYPFWQYLVEEKMLFEINERNKMNFLNPGPTTPGLPAEGSPDRMGRFLGWRIVKQYVDNFNITPQELINLKYNEILQEYEIE